MTSTAGAADTPGRDDAQRRFWDPIGLETIKWDASGTHNVLLGNKKLASKRAFIEADEGIRTLDLLHGKCSRSFALVRARSLKRAGCRGFRSGERTGANPSERRTLPSLPRSRAPDPDSCAAVHDPTQQPRHRTQPCPIETRTLAPRPWRGSGASGRLRSAWRARGGTRGPAVSP
jgi:hypothetical protein